MQLQVTQIAMKLKYFLLSFLRQLLTDKDESTCKINWICVGFERQEVLEKIMQLQVTQLARWIVALPAPSIDDRFFYMSS